MKTCSRLSNTLRTERKHLRLSYSVAQNCQNQWSSKVFNWYTRYVRSLCLCLVESLCAQVSCKIRNPRTLEIYRGTHLVLSKNIHKFPAIVT